MQVHAIPGLQNTHYLGSPSSAAFASSRREPAYVLAHLSASCSAVELQGVTMACRMLESCTYEPLTATLSGIKWRVIAFLYLSGRIYFREQQLCPLFESACFAKAIKQHKRKIHQQRTSLVGCTRKQVNNKACQRTSHAEAVCCNLRPNLACFVPFAVLR